MGIFLILLGVIVIFFVFGSMLSTNINENDSGASNVQQNAASTKGKLWLGYKKQLIAYFGDGKVYVTTDNIPFNEDRCIGTYQSNGEVYDSDGEWCGSVKDGFIQVVKVPKVETVGQSYGENDEGIILENGETLASWKVPSGYKDTLGAKDAAAAAWVIMIREDYPGDMPHHQVFLNR